MACNPTPPESAPPLRCWAPPPWPLEPGATNRKSAAVDQAIRQPKNPEINAWNSVLYGGNYQEKQFYMGITKLQGKNRFCNYHTDNSCDYDETLGLWFGFLSWDGETIYQLVQDFATIHSMHREHGVYPHFIANLLVNMMINHGLFGVYFFTQTNFWCLQPRSCLELGGDWHFTTWAKIQTTIWIWVSMCIYIHRIIYSSTDHRTWCCSSPHSLDQSTLHGGLHVKLSGERLDVVFDEHTHLAARCFRTFKMYRMCIVTKKNAEKVNLSPI